MSDYLDEQDSRALRLNRAMKAPIAPVQITMQEEPKSAWSLAVRLGLIALLVALWLAVAFLPWPRMAWLLGGI
jgi:hypothetical protein